jgi:hypothetical protein
MGVSRPRSEVEGGDHGGVVGVRLVAAPGRIVANRRQGLHAANRLDRGQVGRVDQALAGKDVVDQLPSTLEDPGDRLIRWQQRGQVPQPERVVAMELDRPWPASSGCLSRLCGRSDVGAV